MKFEQMSVDELWQLREELGSVLEAKLIAEKQKLEERLAGLATNFAREQRPARRAYPRVLPKYRNPLNIAETWSGRGKQPGWVLTALKAGKTLGDLAI